MSKVNTWSTTAASNNSASPDGWPEGMPPSGVNNSAREMMAQIRDVWNDKEWFQLGSGTGTQTVTRASTTSVTIAANVSTTYHVGRRIKLYGANGGTIYGKIATSSYSAPNTTISFTFDSGTIHSSDTNPTLWVGSTYSNPSTPVIHDTSLGTSQILPPSQGSVKTYVDTQVTAQDLDLAGDTGTGAVDLDSQSLTFAGTGIDTTVSGYTVTHAIDSTVATLTGSQTLTNKTLTTPDIEEIDSTSGITLDAASDIHLDADGSDIHLKDGGVQYGYISSATQGTNTYTGDLHINSWNSDKDIKFGGNDGGSYITALTLDMSEGGNATFNGNVTASTFSGSLGIGNLTGTGLDSAKIADGSVSNTEFQYINSLSSNAQTQLSGKLTASNNLSDIGTASTARTNLGLGTIATQAASNVAVTGGSITGLGSPSAGSDAATKTYVDDLVTGLKSRIICRVATTANIDLTADLQNGDSLDGITLATDDRVLVKNQTTTTANGVYKVVASGTASRDPDFDTVAELSGQLVIIQEGSSNADTMWLCTTDNSGSIGAVTITFSQVFPSSGGTVTSIGLTQSGTEFTISGSPVTGSGNITLNVNRIAATKIGANSNVSDTEYGYLANVSSDIQTQLDAKATQGFVTAMSIAL